MTEPVYIAYPLNRAAGCWVVTGPGFRSGHLSHTDAEALAERMNRTPA